MSDWGQPARCTDSQPHLLRKLVAYLQQILLQHTLKCLFFHTQLILIFINNSDITFCIYNLLKTVLVTLTNMPHRVFGSLSSVEAWRQMQLSESRVCYGKLFLLQQGISWLAQDHFELLNLLQDGLFILYFKIVLSFSYMLGLRFNEAVGHCWPLIPTFPTVLRCASVPRW